MEQRENTLTTYRDPVALRPVDGRVGPEPRSSLPSRTTRLSLLDGFLLTALCTILAVAPGYSLAAVALAFAVILRSWQGLFPVRSPLILAAVLAAAAVVSATYVDKDAFATQAVVAFFSFTAVYTSANGSQQRARSVLLCIASSAFIASVLFVALARRVVWTGDQYIEVTYEGVRLGFPFASMAPVNHLSYSVALGLACGVAWLLTARRSQVWVRVVVAAGSLVCLGAILMTETRASLVSVAAAIVLGLVVKKGHVLLQAAVPLLAICAFFVTISGSLLSVAKALDVESLFTRDTGTLSGRSDIWQEAHQLALEAPPFGYGLGADPLLAEGFGTHNSFLATWLAFGLAGSAIHLAWVIVCYDHGRLPRDRESSFGLAASSAILGGALPILLTGMFEWAGILWAAMAACSTMSTIKRSSSMP